MMKWSLTRSTGTSRVFRKKVIIDLASDEALLRLGTGLLTSNHDRRRFQERLFLTKSIFMTRLFKARFKQIISRIRTERYS